MIRITRKALALAWLCPLGAVLGEPPRELRTRRVVLITVDGLRHQELFGGLEPRMLEDKKRSGIEDVERLRSLYLRPTARERREALLPFFWKTFAPRGVVLGNKARGSRALLRNRRRFSYPGYAELLTGAPQDTITSNAKVRLPRPSFLEFVRTKLRLPREKVALFASWDVFSWIASQQKDAVFTNAGYEAMPSELSSPEMARLSRLQFSLLTPWDTVRHDTVTAELALGYLERLRPRLLYLALGETDDWAHERRYDRVLAAARLFDETLERTWKTLESMETYRGRTTIIITTDHGRGSTLDDWTDHGEKVPDAEDIWIAVAGPDTPPRGEAADVPRVHLGDVAATVLVLLGLDPQEFNPAAGPPIPLAFQK
ncbi:MAG: alkaline phosphatase family protein [Planctomycetota bacterium]|nr:alkaline phosphatase family protein [Planctomycetota bacterium]